jgi:hypothetical protein
MHVVTYKNKRPTVHLADPAFIHPFIHSVWFICELGTKGIQENTKQAYFVLMGPLLEGNEQKTINEQITKYNF